LKNIIDRNSQTEVTESKKPVLIQFVIPWPGTCHIISTVDESLANQFKDRVKFCKINVFFHPQAADKFGVQNFPTILFINNGKEIDRLIGMIPRSLLQQRLTDLINEADIQVLET